MKMNYRDNKYFPNGAIIGDTFYSDDKDLFSYTFSCYFRDTEVLHISTSMIIDKNGEYIPDIAIWIRGNEEYGTTTTNQTLRRYANTIHEMFNYDFGDLFINTANHIFKGIVSEVCDLYREKHNTDITELHTINVFNKEYEANIYFN